MKTLRPHPVVQVVISVKQMKHLPIISYVLIAALAGCTQSDHVEQVAANNDRTPFVEESDCNIEITDTALPVLKSALQSADDGDAIIYSMEWPAGLCSTQHHLEIGTPSSNHEVATISGIRIAYVGKYKKFVNGIVIDYGTRGTESGLKFENPELDLYSIVHSESDSKLMTEMLGGGFTAYREMVLSGGILLEPKIKAE